MAICSQAKSLQLLLSEKIKMYAKKFAAWLTPFLSILIMSFLASTINGHTRNTVDSEKPPLSTPYNSYFSDAAGLLVGDKKSGAAHLATDAASNSAEEWLNKFGTARISLNVDRDGTWDNSSFDFLKVLADSERLLTYTQFGLRVPNSRVTGNFGLGVRSYYVNSWMLGGNIFFDRDFTGKNNRIGIGGEAWSDYIKLATNVYFGTTKWHSSRDFNSYEEKPANGFDIRVDSFLPFYPKIGTKFVFEQYYGDEVALFNKENLQKDPYSVTMGLNYTPVPLLTVGIDYRLGQKTTEEVKFNLGFNYTFGESWKAQTSPSQVAVKRSLAGARYDLVDRNNEIILKYRKKEDKLTVSDINLIVTKNNSPADGLAINIVTLQALSSEGRVVPNAPIVWSASGSAILAQKTSVTDSNGNISIQLTNKSAEKVLVKASSGQASRTIEVIFSQSVADLNLVLTKDKSQADGSEKNSGLVTVLDANGKAMSDVELQWQVDNGASLITKSVVTDEKGQGSASFSSPKPGMVKLSVSAGDKKESVDSSFSDLSLNSVKVNVTTNSVAADGKTPVVVKAVVKDTAGRPVADAVVTWTLSGSAKSSDGKLSGTTDAKGEVTLSLTDTVAEAVTVTAAAGGKSGSAVATFTVAPVGSVALNFATDSTVPADGQTKAKLKAKVKDTAGRPVADAVVTWTLSGSAKSSDGKLSGTTDAKGEVTLSLTDMTVQTVDVTATVSGKSDTVTVKFRKTKAVKLEIISSTGKGSAANRLGILTAKATDINGNPVQGVSVSWKNMMGSILQCNTYRSTTDENGEARQGCYAVGTNIQDSIITATAYPSETVEPTKPLEASYTRSYLF